MACLHLSAWLRGVLWRSPALAYSDNVAGVTVPFQVQENSPNKDQQKHPGMYTNTSPEMPTQLQIMRGKVDFAVRSLLALQDQKSGGQEPGCSMKGSPGFEAVQLGPPLMKPCRMGQMPKSSFRKVEEQRVMDSAKVKVSVGLPGVAVSLERPARPSCEPSRQGRSGSRPG